MEELTQQISHFHILGWIDREEIEGKRLEADHVFASSWRFACTRAEMLSALRCRRPC